MYFEGELSKIPTEELKVSKLNPRIDLGDIESLVNNIKENGIRFPLIVRKKNGHKEVILGGRRLEAAKRLGIEEVPCQIVEESDVNVVESNIIENVLREGLKPYERAQAYKFLVDEEYGSVASLADSFGLDYKKVKRELELLETPPSIRSRVGEGPGEFNLSHIKVLKEEANSSHEWEEWADRVEDEKMTAEELEENLESDEEYRQDSFNRMYSHFVSVEPDELIKAMEEKKVTTEEPVFNGQNIVITARVKGEAKGRERIEDNKYEVEFE